MGFTGKTVLVTGPSRHTGQALAITRDRLVGTRSQNITNRGYSFSGLRVPCDALVSASSGLTAVLARPRMTCV